MRWFFVVWLSLSALHRSLEQLPNERMAIMAIDNFISKDPLGTIFIIAPWNYPYNTSVNSVVPSLLSGNCVILQHSSQTPLCAEQLYNAAKLSGLPAVVFQFLHLDHQSTSKIIADKKIDHVLFIGFGPFENPLYALSILIGCPSSSIHRSSGPCM